MYRVLHQFHDLTDGVQTKAGMIYHLYQPGDFYPRQGMDVSPERIAMLASSDNAQGMPLIEPIVRLEAAEPECLPEEPVAEELPEKPRRSRKAKKETA